MKRCSSCNREYTDEALNFCSYDGVPLSDLEATTVLTTLLDRKLPPDDAYPPDNTPSSLNSKPYSIVHRALCSYCGNTTPQTLLYFHRIVDDEIPLSYGKLLFECGTCRMALLYYLFDPPKLINNEVINAKIQTQRGQFELVYPDAMTWIGDNSVPAAVRDCYLEAVKNTRKGDAFAAQIRKALEAICDERNVAKGRLHYRLNEMASLYRLPTLIVEIANELREIGNIGSHVGQQNVPDYLTTRIESLFRAIVNYLYITPATLSNLRYHLRK